jgi:hypothetical protein
MVAESTPEAARERYQEWYEQLRSKVFSYYGPSCACCGSTENLSIDHVNGDGAEHREELFGNERYGGGWKFWLWLVQNDFPCGFQVLCRSCNLSKGKGRECILCHVDVPGGMKYCAAREHEGPRVLPVSEFSQDCRRPDGLDRYCRACKSRFGKRTRANQIRSGLSAERARRIIAELTRPGQDARPQSRPKPDTEAGRPW